MSRDHHDGLLSGLPRTSSLILYTLCLTLVSCHSNVDQTVHSMNSGARNIFVTPQKLKQQLTRDSSMLLIKVGYGPASGKFIPGSIYLNTDEIEYDHFEIRSVHPVSRTTSPQQDSAKGLTPNDTLPRNYWNLYPDSLLLKALAFGGIKSSSFVTVYSEEPEAASRLAWCLICVGLESVQVLDGGLPRWINAGFETVEEEQPRKPAESFGRQLVQNERFSISTKSVRESLLEADTGIILVDVRSRSEFRGDTSIYAYIPVTGRIPGAVYGGTAKGNVSMSDYVDSDGRIRNREVLSSLFESWGISSDHRIAFYCGTGWRSSLAWLIAYDMGWNKVANYDGSWYEWSMGPESSMNRMILPDAEDSLR